MNLLMILLVLFASLYVVVKLAERYGKPMDPEQQAKFSKIAIILMGIMLVAGILKLAF